MSMLNLNKTIISQTKENTRLAKMKVVNETEISKDVEKKQLEASSSDKIRKFYVEHSSKPTYAETARRFRIDISIIAELAKGENWFEQRIVFWNQNAADQQQSIHAANESIFKSLSIVAQLAIKEHAQIMIDIEKAKQKGIVVKSNSYDPAYNIKDAMALVKLLNTNTEILQEQLNQSEKTLLQTNDDELLELLSEDEKYELDMFYVDNDKEEEEEKFEKLLI